MNFENGAMKVIVMWTDATHHTPDFPSGYPGPSVQDVVDAALAEGIIGGRRNLQTETTNGFTIRIVGINAGGDSVQTELENLALKTGAIAPFGLKCCRTCAESTPTEGDAPIVCPSVDGVNIGESIVAVVMTAVNSAEVQIAGGSTTSGSSGGGVLPPPGGDCCDLTGRPCQHDNLGDDTCFEMQDGTCPHGTTDICSWVCTNDKWYRDSGCEDPGVQGKKVCVYLDGTEPNRDQEGEKCVVCINNKATGKDRGCTLNKPNCKFNGAEPISGGKVGNQCV